MSLHAPRHVSWHAVLQSFLQPSLQVLWHAVLHPFVQPPLHEQVVVDDVDLCIFFQVPPTLTFANPIYFTSFYRGR